MRYLLVVQVNGETGELEGSLNDLGFYEVIRVEGEWYQLPEGVYYGVSDLLTEQLANQVEGIIAGLGLELRCLLVVIYARAVARGERIN